MTFEEQLARAFDTLTERLRGEIDQEVQRRTAEAIAAAPRASEPVPIAEAPAAGDGVRARLAVGFDAIDGARSLTEILDALLTFARADGARADLWLMRGGRPYRWRTGADRGDDDAPAPLPDAAIPLAIGGGVVALLDVERRTTNGERPTTNVELLTRFAARSLEALTAFKTARALTQRAAAEADRPQGDGDEASAEEDTSARRYARLLVSEIRLYHESAVVDGRRDRDLSTRLGGEIARARVMYEQRVPPHVRERADYFQDELVRTLADGDASLLELRTKK